MNALGNRESRAVRELTTAETDRVGGGYYTPPPPHALAPPSSPPLPKTPGANEPPNAHY
jgi:hypothetical protein